MTRPCHLALIVAPVLLALGVAGCSGALVGEDYRGESLLRFEAILEDYLELASRSRAGLRAGLFWNLESATSTDARALVEQRGVVTEVELPGTLRLSVLHPPSGAGLERVTTTVFVGQILVYEDLDGDGALTDGELRGGAPDTIVLYAPEPLEAAHSPTGRPLTRGYSTAISPLPCGQPRLEPPPLEATCGVPIGAACAADADCGAGGHCLSGLDDYFGAFNNGYCTVLSGSDSCRPSAAIYHSSWDPVLNAPSPGYWFQSCTSDLDCRFDEGYECWEDEGACYPRGMQVVYIGSDFSVAPLCVEE